MTVRTDIGHASLRADGTEYVLRPTIERISTLGDGRELVRLYNLIHGIGQEPATTPGNAEFNAAMRVNAARDVIAACSDDPMVCNLLVRMEFRNDRWAMRIKSTNHVKPELQIAVASQLLRHGVSGVTKVETSGASKAASEVDVWDAAYTAQSLLGMTAREARQLTMTEFLRLWYIKHPPQKEDTPGSEAPDIDEHNALMDQLRKRNAKMEAMKNGN